MAVFVLFVACAGLARAAEDPQIEELRKQVQALQAEVARLKGAGADGARLAELERRIDLLAAEIEKSRTGGAAEAEPVAETPVPGFGPAASKVYAKPHGVSIGGYGEAVYDNASAERQDGEPSGATDRIDLVRNVLYVGYKFTDRILFNSELEVEHATTGEGDEEKGEVSAEFAYLDFKPWKNVGLRAGQLLMPVGFLNELHEPPVFHGVQRNQVEQVIIPTTWRDVGAGVFGEFGRGWRYRAYAMAPLNASASRLTGLIDFACSIAFFAAGRSLRSSSSCASRTCARTDVGSAAARGKTCGVAFDEQIVREVPVEPHDSDVNCILTPTRWIAKWRSSRSLCVSGMCRASIRLVIVRRQARCGGASSSMPAILRRRRREPPGAPQSRAGLADLSDS
jgi:uncharacterized small protein (DUF1192 family)